MVVAGLAERIGLRTPRLVALDLDPEIARYEADEEVQDLLNASPGLNLGADFLPGSFGFDGHVPGREPTDPVRVLWLDAFVANVDRSWRNPNLLLWHGNLWVIDHGAALYFHHGWAGGVGDPARFAAQAWSADDHVFREHAAELPAVGRRAPRLLGREVFADVLAEVPDTWLEPVPGAERPGRRARGVRRLPHRPPRHPPVAPAGGGMTEQKLSYEYVVLRCVPRVDREEFVNVGVVLHCQMADFLDVAWHVDRERLLALDPRIDVDQVCESLAFVEAVCAGHPTGGAPAAEPLTQRFGFLKAPRSHRPPARPRPRRRHRRPRPPARTPPRAARRLSRGLCRR